MRRFALATLLAVSCASVSKWSGTGSGPAGPSEPEAAFVTAADGDFYLGKKRLRFIGVNVYSLASSPDPSKYACGPRFSDDDLDRLFGEVKEMGGAVVRFWAFQSFTEGGTDFSRIDAVIAAAKKHGLLLAPTLENQWEDCTQGGYKYAEWYRSGHRYEDGYYPRSFREYVELIVERYRDEPAILMWQLLNEAESKTPEDVSDPAALLAFAIDLSSLVKSIDPNHLVSLGTIGGDQSGTEGSFYMRLHAVPWIDVVEAHEYNAHRRPLTPSIRNCLAAGRQFKKPCLIGELGMIAHTPEEKLTRAGRVIRQLEAMWEAGVDGALIWSYRAGDGLNLDFDRDDPLFDALRDFSAGH